jgi:outer membrane immunogenic protein
MMMFRSLTLASAAALTLTAPAFAQPADSGAVTWTGPYVGLNAGYGGGDFRYPFSGATTSGETTTAVQGELRQSSSGGLGGGQLGYNFQAPVGLVFGLEADIDAADIGGRADFHSADSSGTFTSGGVDSKINYLGTVRARVGAPLFEGRFLPYVTGGFAYGDVRTSVGFDCSGCEGGASATDIHTQTGWTIGAGTEYALDRHLSFRVEYLYADLGSHDLSPDTGVAFAPGFSLDNASIREKTDANLIRAGLNYRF